MYLDFELVLRRPIETTRVTVHVEAGTVFGIDLERNDDLRECLKRSCAVTVRDL